MPGGRGALASRTWFQDVFGFTEDKYLETRRKFEFADGVLSCPSSGRSFHVGLFEVLSVADLRRRLAELPPAPDAEGLRFSNIVGNAKALHLSEENAGAVFQAASQFNCLEMVGPDVRPQDGITRYAMDATQGPACALSCPAATAYRNYMVNDGVGQGTGHQIDCLAEVDALVNNGKEHYWRMRNGYAMPCNPGSIGPLSRRISADPGLADAIRERVQVGVHWDTEVLGGRQRVCQVFCSAVPVSYSKSTRAADWQAFACVILDAIFEATLAAAACLALEQRRRVKVFLTAVGGGAFGNRSLWIVQAMEEAMKAYAAAPIDVMLVHFASIPKSTYTSLERGRGRVRNAELGKTFGRPEESAALVVPVDAAPVLERSDSESAKFIRAFQVLDLNGDGVIDRTEFVEVLRRCDSEFFSDDVLDTIFAAADVDADGQVHYAEFAAWVCAEDSAEAARLLATCAAAASD